MEATVTAMHLDEQEMKADTAFMRNAHISANNVFVQTKENEHGNRELNISLVKKALANQRTKYDLVLLNGVISMVKEDDDVIKLLNVLKYWLKED